MKVARSPAMSFSSYGAAVFTFCLSRRKIMTKFIRIAIAALALAGGISAMSGSANARWHHGHHHMHCSWHHHHRHCW
jgi:hypothetical protein